ncbi:MAG: S-layer family protein, partial [Moorea sp. SIO3G5]|nr:S-layer family protein [Moorena sp. SIO3G5]
ITADITRDSKGNPGNIEITAQDKIKLNNSDIGTSVGPNAGNPERAENTPGGVGNITITARSLSLKDSGKLETLTLGKLPAGNITVNATDFVEISGKNRSRIVTETQKGAEGKGGRIDITTKTLNLSDGGVLNARSESDFDGGDINIDADQVQLTDSAEIIATSEKMRGGDITLDSDTLTVNNSEISASTETGIAGNVTLETDKLTVENGARIAVSGVELTETGFPKIKQDDSQEVVVGGVAGTLTIKAESLTLDNGQLVAATGKQTNNQEAATIEINVPGVIILDNNSLILASATGDGVDGGNIDISGGVLVALPLTNDDKGSDIFANAQQGDGGKINITLQGLFNMKVLEDTSAFIGSDGNIIESIAFENNDSEIAALSLSSGESGTVTRDITGSAQDPENLPTSLVDPSALIVANCASSGKAAVDELGEFIITGRGGLPPSPLDPMNSQSVWVDLRILDPQQENIEEATSTPTPEVSYLPMRGKRRTANTPTPARPKKIVEAQGWNVKEDGTIILTAEPNNVTPKSNWYIPRSCGSKG